MSATFRATQQLSYPQSRLLGFHEFVGQDRFLNIEMGPRCVYHLIMERAFAQARTERLYCRRFTRDEPTAYAGTGAAATVLFMLHRWKQESK